MSGSIKGFKPKKGATQKALGLALFSRIALGSPAYKIL